MARDFDCPRCDCSATFRVHRKPREYMLLGCRAFLCMDCRRRFLLFELDKLLTWHTVT